MHILIININNLQLTKALLNNIFSQTYPYRLTVVDNGSREEGTKEYFRSVGVDFVCNSKNEPICHLWNKLYQSSNDECLCCLNNDVTVFPNFVWDTVNILNSDKEIGCVIYSTNNPNYQMTSPTEYAVVDSRITHGWAFTIRKSAYTPIPEDIEFYGGDDFLFTNLYEKGWKVAMCLSSPIVHYRASSRKYYSGIRESEMKAYFKHVAIRLPYYSPYSMDFPPFSEMRKS